MKILSRRPFSLFVPGAVAISLVLGACRGREPAPPAPRGMNPKPVPSQEIAGFDAEITAHAGAMIAEGRETFRNDTFGSEAFWGDVLGLHEAIDGSRSENGGLSLRTALAVGLKIDRECLPAELVEKIRRNALNLDDPLSTVALLKLNAVVGVKGFFEEHGRLKSVGITCALCHSTVDDSTKAGIGRRLDGWPNRDLDVGKIVSLAPNLDPLAKMLKVDVATVKKVLLSWGPGRYDAELDKDGKATRPDGKSGATLLPPAYGLAGVNLHTYTGFGSVPYWNAYVATTQMHGRGVFFDQRLDQAAQYPVAERTGSWNVRNVHDRITPKLAALQYYQLSIPAPRPPAGSFDRAAFGRGEKLFAGKAKCASCHVPPLFTEPGRNLHSPEEIGIDNFQSERSPTRSYRTTPLRGLWAHQKGGFYHDGRFASLDEVVKHYDQHLRLKLSDDERKDLVQYLLGL